MPRPMPNAPQSAVETAPFHHPVLLEEVRELFAGCRARRVVVDGTVGLGGHSAQLLADAGPQLELLLALDRDPEALAIARARLSDPGGAPVLCHNASFAEIPRLLREEEIPGASFILLDLGVSTFQLKTPIRGFSFANDGPLDMRMDPSSGSSARELLERSTVAQLEGWLRDFGEVRHAGRIARALYERRSSLRTTSALSAAVLEALRIRRPVPGEIHPATQVFQALRIAVNRELETLEAALPALIEALEPGGRLAVISFHSLEDRRVKQAFDRASRDCVCPPKMPACGCGHRASVQLLFRGARQPGETEVAENPPSRSARLRAVEKLSNS